MNQNIRARKTLHNPRFHLIPQMMRLGEGHRSGEFEMEVDEKVRTEATRAEAMDA